MSTTWHTLPAEMLEIHENVKLEFDIDKLPFVIKVSKNTCWYCQAHMHQHDQDNSVPDYMQEFSEHFKK